MPMPGKYDTPARQARAIDKPAGRKVITKQHGLTQFLGRRPMITLTKDMETGVEKIDAQHKELITRLNAVVTMGTSAVSKEETQKTINFLEEYIIKHFREEEALQRQCRYPKYEWHKAQHAGYINDFKKLKEEFAANGPSAKFTVSLNTSVINWIVKHIKVVDVELGKFYRENTP
jgi:hemerythrin